MANVSLENVCKIYDGCNYVVKDVNLEIKDREFLVLVGPSGCGKSTTLRMIAGLEEISKGIIRIGNRIVNDVIPKDRDIAMVFQNYALYPHMTVYDNMAFGLTLRKVNKAEIKTRVLQAAKILGIESYLDRRPKALSGGQRQRVAVGRAIVRNPAVFLFDEPLSNLDAKMRVQMRTEINKLHNQLQATMIYVTHDQVEAMTMGERICVMKDGVIQQVADPLTCYNNPVNKFVAGFIGTPPMNFISGKIIVQEGKFLFQNDDLKFVIPIEWNEKLKEYIDSKVIFGIRPEHINAPTEWNPEGYILNAKVSLVEPMGAETYIYLALGGEQIIARVDSNIQLSFNDEVKFPFNVKMAHFFSAETEKVIV